MILYSAVALQGAFLRITLQRRELMDLMKNFLFLFFSHGPDPGFRHRSVLARD